MLQWSLPFCTFHSVYFSMHSASSRHRLEEVGMLLVELRPSCFLQRFLRGNNSISNTRHDSCSYGRMKFKPDSVASFNAKTATITNIEPTINLDNTHYADADCDTWCVCVCCLHGCHHREATSTVSDYSSDSKDWHDSGPGALPKVGNLRHQCTVRTILKICRAR